MFCLRCEHSSAEDFGGNECVNMEDESCILIKCIIKSGFGVMGRRRSCPPPWLILGSGWWFGHLCILSWPQISSIHVICTLTYYFSFFFSLDWFWDGRTSNTNILCLVIVSLANLPKKSPCHGKDHKTDGNTLRTHQASSLLINVMPQEHWDPQRMCFGWVMTINDGQCLIKNRVVVTNERTLLNTMLQLIQTFFINKDKYLE